MEIIPAVDLRHGKCVRLYQGNYEKETVFSEDPVAMALHWQAEGAGRLHIVDLDGAAEGKLCHKSIIEAIVHKLRIPVQVGGGVRNLETIKQLFNVGVERVILGTAAVEDPALVKEACDEFGERIIISVDAKDGYVRGHGWKKEVGLSIAEVIRRVESLGVRRLIYTDINRDGTLAGPNFDQIAKVKSQAQIPIIIAGGVSSLEHLKKLADLGVEGVILGQALYTGKLRLRKVLNELIQK